MYSKVRGVLMKKPDFDFETFPARWEGLEESLSFISSLPLKQLQKPARAVVLSTHDPNAVQVSIPPALS